MNTLWSNIKSSCHPVFSVIVLRNVIIGSLLQEGQGLAFEGERRLLEYRLKNETARETIQEGTNVIQVRERINPRVSASLSNNKLKKCMFTQEYSCTQELFWWLQNWDIVLQRSYATII